MSLVQLDVMYGHLEGTEGRFARDPSGYLSIEAGIFRKHGLDVSWIHVQGTEERYRRLESAKAQLSLVVGRASLQHFLASRKTRILGCAMNRCPYYLVAEPSIRELKDLQGKVIACREAPSRNAPIAQIFEEQAQLRLGEDFKLQLPNGDQDAFSSLVQGRVQAAFLPRPFGFWAEEKGFKRITGWPDVVDDPLPITIETTQKLVSERGKEFEAFLAAHREGLQYLKAHRTETIRMLEKQFGHSPTFAAKTFDDYLVCMDDQLKVDLDQLEKLLAQVTLATPVGASEVASEWIVSGAVKG